MVKLHAIEADQLVVHLGEVRLARALDHQTADDVVRDDGQHRVGDVTNHAVLIDRREQVE